jgi:hypothetical protein
MASVGNVENLPKPFVITETICPIVANIGTRLTDKLLMEL